MAFLFGIIDEDQSPTSPSLIICLHLYPRNCGSKERFPTCGEIITHIDMDSSFRIALHNEKTARKWTS